MKRTLLIVLSLLPTLSFGQIKIDLPEDALGYFYLPHLDRTLTKIDAQLAPLGKSTQNTKEIFSTLFLRNTKPQSIDFSKEILYIRLNPETCPNPFLYTAYVQDKELFLSGFGKELLGGKGFVLKEETRNQPIQEYVEERTQFDRDGYLKALSQGAADVVQFQKKITLSYYLAFSNSRVMVSGNRELIKKLGAATQTPLQAGEDTDLEIVLKPARLYQTYQQEIASLREKFNPLLSSNSPLLPPLLPILESHLMEIRQIQLKGGIKNENLELEMNLEPTESSKLSQLSKKPSQSHHRLTEAPAPDTLGLLRIWLTNREESMKILQAFQNPDLQTLIQNYLNQTEGLFSLYILPSENSVKALIAGLPKTKAAAPAETLGSETYQVGQTQLYNVFSHQQHWIGIGFNSLEEFKSDVQKISETPREANPEFLKAVVGFPENLDLLSYVRPPWGGLISGYGKFEGTKLLLFVRITFSNPSTSSQSA